MDFKNIRVNLEKRSYFFLFHLYFETDGEKVTWKGYNNRKETTTGNKRKWTMVNI